MSKNKHYDTPTQVCFWDWDANEWLAGIAWGDNIICGCCGGVFEIAEIYENAPQEIKKPVVEFNYWVNFSEEIVGDCWPLNPINADEEKYID